MMNRREFLGATAGTLAASALSPAMAASDRVNLGIIGPEAAARRS